MILSDVELMAELDRGGLVIEPRPGPDQWSGSSVDLTLAEKILVLRPTSGMSADPSEIENINDLLESFGDVKDLPYDLPPGTFFLGTTRERLVLPQYLGARVEGKSSFARFGLAVHQTAPTIQPGFDGVLTLEMYNCGPFGLKLTPGVRICQLIVERLGLPAVRGGAGGRFQGQGTI